MRNEPEQSGRVLDGRYRVLSRLGEGGMGTVYLAEHIGLGQRQAIKFLNREFVHQPAVVQRFLQEARIVSKLNHEHVIRVFDMKQSGDVAYYVMELLDGEDLRALLDRTRVLSWSRVRTIMLQLCSALQTAHAHGIVHRDLKPENCFCVRRDDGADHIKILDFGIAKVSKEAGGVRLTATGEALGTIAYMAPEQAEGRADQRSDIYALGVMMYEMLSGRLPHDGTPIEIIAKLVRGTRAPPLREIDPGFAPEISALVERAMSPDPGGRFPEIAALAAAISAMPDKALATTAIHHRPAARPLVQRHGVRLSGALGLGLVIFVLVFSAAWKLLSLGSPIATGDTLATPALAPAINYPPNRPVEAPTLAPQSAVQVPADPAVSITGTANDVGTAAEPVPPSPEPTAVPAPTRHPATKVSGLSRKALESKLRALLAGCTPGFITETIKIRATPREPGGSARLDLVHPGGLRRQDVECVRTALKGASLRIAETEAITVDIKLEAK